MDYSEAIACVMPGSPDSKSLIVAGNMLSGKTTLINQVIAKYGVKEVFYLNGRDVNLPGRAFLFDGCSPETKIIVVTNIKEYNPLFSFFSSLDSNITINRKHDKPFQITGVKFILEVDTNLTIPTERNMASLLRRFNLINLPARQSVAEIDCFFKMQSYEHEVNPLPVKSYDFRMTFSTTLTVGDEEDTLKKLCVGALLDIGLHNACIISIRYNYRELNHLDTIFIPSPYEHSKKH